MFDFLDKLRAKPERARRRILYVTCAVLMMLVIGVWGTTLQARYGAPKEEQVAYKKHSPTSVLTQTGSAFFSGMKSTLLQVKGEYENMKSAFQEPDAGPESPSAAPQVGAPVIATSTDESTSSFSTKANATSTASSTTKATTTFHNEEKR